MSGSEIASLPLSEDERAAFVECAHEAFERVLERIEAQNPEATRRLWDAEVYVRSVLKPEMLPIEREYALSLVEAFLVHHVIDLAVRADEGAGRFVH